MRWLWAAVISGMSCGQPASPDAGFDAGTQQQRDASFPIPEQPLEVYDPCVWDGLSDDGICSAETWVFEKLSCRPACGPRPRFGRPGVFATEAECKATCPCEPEKFFGWPWDPQLDHFVQFGLCDEVLAFTDAGAPEVPGLGCTTERNQLSRPGDQVCRVGERELARTALSRACRASVQPQVSGVTCIIGE